LNAARPNGNPPSRSDPLFQNSLSASGCWEISAVHRRPLENIRFIPIVLHNHYGLTRWRPYPLIRDTEDDQSRNADCRCKMAHPGITAHETPRVREQCGKNRQGKTFCDMHPQSFRFTGKAGKSFIGRSQRQDHGDFEPFPKPSDQCPPSPQRPYLSKATASGMDENRFLPLQIRFPGQP